VPAQLPVPRQSAPDASVPFSGPAPRDRTEQIRPWQEAVVKTTTPIPLPPPRSGRSPLVWVGAAAAVIALAVAGWIAGARSAQRLGPSVAGAGTLASPSALPSTLARPTTATSPPASAHPPPAAEPVERFADDAQKAATGGGENARETSSHDRAEPPTPTGRPPMPSAPRVVDPGPALRLAEAAESRGDLTQALAHYRDALRIDPTNATATRQIARIRAGYFLRRAETLLDAGDYDAAQRDATSAIETDPGNPAAAELLKKIERARSAEIRKRPPTP